MDCPRCSGRVVTYALGEASSMVCEGCGYVGVPADHSPEPTAEESWGEALERFYRSHRADSEARRIDVGDATYAVPEALAERVDGLTEKQLAVVRELLCESDPTDPDRTREELGEAAGVHPSYAGEITRKQRDVVAALAAAKD